MDNEKLTLLALGNVAGYAVARLHVDASASVVVSHVAAQIGNFGTAHPREIAYFIAACVARHYWNRAAYTVAVRSA